MYSKIKVIGFDADDTLWVNEPYFQEVEKQFCNILKPYLGENETSKKLFETEMQNLEIYGYGAKGFMLSMIETALNATEGKITPAELTQIIDAGKSLLTMPIQLLEGVETVLKQLQGKYRLILATKGDLLDQERKLQKSGLAQYFHHIEIMSDKQESNYRKLLAHLDIEPSEFLMVGNSVKSDIIPVVNIGSQAIHVPFEVTWQHETHHSPAENINYVTISKISQLPAHL
ncbi:MAG: HAD family hydrolase [Prolixibacteraceae bacterium]|nr:HAD family hydrolase [Prolixibacteraceae bacterium]